MKLWSKAIVVMLFIPSFSSIAATISVTGGGAASSSYVSEITTSNPLYMIGMYEADTEGHWENNNGQYEYVYTRERGTATIYIDEQFNADVTLALGSYEQTNWVLEGPGVSNVSNIILHGYRSQTVTGYDSNSDIQEFTFEGSGIYIPQTYYWPQEDELCIDSYSDYDLCRSIDVIDRIEALTARDVSAFVGTYSATSFRISQHDPSVVPVPAAVWLFGSGLIGLVGLARRNKS